MDEVPPDHWDQQRYFSAEPNRSGKISSPLGGYLKNVYDFDPQFFGISPREALSLDPQQRLLLEVAWEALDMQANRPNNCSTARPGCLSA